MYMIHKHKTMAENWNMSMIFKLYKKCNLDIYKLSKNYIVHTLVCFCNSFKTKAGRLKPMNVKDKTECKKGLIKSNYLVSYLLRSLKKMWRLKGVKGGKEAQWGKNICNFAFEFNEILWFFTLFKTEITKIAQFSIRLIPFQCVGTKIWWLFKCPGCLDLTLL